MRRLEHVRTRARSQRSVDQLAVVVRRENDRLRVWRALQGTLNEGDWIDSVVRLELRDEDVGMVLVEHRKSALGRGGLSHHVHADPIEDFLDRLQPQREAIEQDPGLVTCFHRKGRSFRPGTLPQFASEHTTLSYSFLAELRIE